MFIYFYSNSRFEKSIQKTLPRWYANGPKSSIWEAWRICKGMTRDFISWPSNCLIKPVLLRYLCRLQAYHCIFYILGSRNRVSQIGFDSNVCKFGSGWTGKLYDIEYLIFYNDLILRFSTNQFKISFRTLCVFWQLKHACPYHLYYKQKMLSSL